jgi:hypothetical protein
MSPPSSGSKNRLSKKQHEAGSKLSRAGFLLGLFFGAEDEGDMLLQNVG